jgi:(+)-trans-carveol dehydrogenase
VAFSSSRPQAGMIAIGLAQEGADIIAVGLAAQVAAVPYPLATPEDLAVTVKKVQALARRIVAAQADVRDFGRSRPPWTAAWPSSGGWTSRRPTPGFFGFSRLEGLDDATWQDMIDVSLTGVWHTVKAAIPHLRAADGGSIILTRSAVGLKAIPDTGHYNSA